MTREKMWEEFETGIIDVIERWKKRLEQEPFNIDTYCEEHFVVMVDKDLWETAEKALEQEPCDDAISRQAVLDLIADYDLSMGQVVKGIHALPSVKPQEPKTEWIPIEWRPFGKNGYPKPEDEYKHFLTIDNKGEITIQEFLLSLDEEPQPYFTGMRKVKAWMPLPEPYKVESEVSE